MSTDKEMFNQIPKTMKKTGRPQLDRELGYKLISSGKSTQYIRRVLKCSSRSIRMLKDEMKQQGIVAEKLSEEEIDRQAIDFKQECLDVMEYDFEDWLKSKTKNWKRLFTFAKMVWSDIWEKPNLFLLKDRSNSLGDQLAIKFMAFFGNDVQRIRRRKKYIRHLFTFFGREDINNRHLTMSRSRDPNEVRELPQITFADFPIKLDKAINLVGEAMGREAKLALRLKLVTQMRTGKAIDNRELFGIQVKKTDHSYIIMNSLDEYNFKVSAKANETWSITWIPIEVRKELYELYKLRNIGEKLFQIDRTKLLKTWKEVTESVGLPPLILHDLRKVCISWLYVLGIPLELATQLNVGWRDLNTARDYYLQYRQAIKRDQRKIYQANIPSWFKEGLDQYSEML